MLWAQPVAADFHARFAATARHYTYLLLTRAERPGAARAAASAGTIAPLDVEAMRAGAAHLVGTHDFSAFRAAECQAKSPVKTLAAHRRSTRDGALIRFDFSADAFLHHMVRNIVGALVYVGAGKQPPDWIGELLAARDRTRAAPTFAADGLYFTGAEYDARFGLPPTRRAASVLACRGPVDDACARASRSAASRASPTALAAARRRRRRDRPRVLARHAARRRRRHARARSPTRCRRS